jgi:hypothetical protein
MIGRAAFQVEGHLRTEHGRRSLQRRPYIFDVNVAGENLRRRK